jgi:glutaredoxin 3
MTAPHINIVGQTLAAAVPRPHAHRHPHAAASAAALVAAEPAETFVVFGTSWCPYCSGAVKILESRGAPYRFVDVELEPHLNPRSITGDTSVPQIFRGGAYLGGYAELAGRPA